MGIQLQDQPADARPHSSVRRENGVVEFRIRTVFAPWLKWTIAVTAFLLIASFSTLGSVVQSQTKADEWSTLAIVSAIGCGILIYALVMFLMAAMLVSSATAEAILDAKKLRIKDRFTWYDIPVSEIYSIRHVAYPGSRIDIETDAPPKRFFYRGRRTAMEVRLPDGVIEFFRSWDEREVAWLVQNIQNSLFPGSAADHAPAVIDKSRHEDIAVAGEMDARPWRVLVLVFLAVGIGCTTYSGWHLFLRLHSRNWSIVQGRVVHSIYEVTTASDGSHQYNAQFDYSYPAGTKTYRGDDLGFGRGWDEPAIKDIITRHPPGSSVTVYYNPTQPARSTVIPGVSIQLWFLMGTSALVLILAIVLTRRRPTAKQAAISRRYKVYPARHQHRVEEIAAGIRWTVPQEAFEDAVRAFRRERLAMSIRIFAIIALCLWAAHHWLARIFEPDFPWLRVDEIMMGFVAVWVATQFLEMFLVRRTLPTYALTSKGILLPSRERPLISWTNIVAFSTNPHRRLPHIRTMTVFMKPGVRREILLPGGELEQTILIEMASHVPGGPCPPKYRPLRPRDWTTGFAAVALTILIAGEILSRHLHQLHGRPWVDQIMLAGMIFGPGTWLAVALWNRRARPSLVAMAGILDLFATLGAFVFAIFHLASPVIR